MGCLLRPNYLSLCRVREATLRKTVKVVNMSVRSVTLLNILHLLAHLFDQHLKLNGDLGHFLVGGFGA